MLLSILLFITQEKSREYVYECLVIQEEGLQELLLVVMIGYRQPTLQKAQIFLRVYWAGCVYTKQQIPSSETRVYLSTLFQ